MPAGPGSGTGSGDAETVDRVLAALADPTRRAVLDAVAEHGPLTATTLASGLPVSRQAVTKHLDVLAAAGLVQARRHGREVRYLVRPGGLKETSRWLARRAARWDRRLAAVKELAERG